MTQGAWGVGGEGYIACMYGGGILAGVAGELSGNYHWAKWIRTEKWGRKEESLEGTKNYKPFAELPLCHIIFSGHCKHRQRCSL